VLIETDLLIASIDPKDPNHEIGEKILTEYEVILSPYAPIELDLLLKSSVIIVKDYIRFWHKLDDMLKQYEIRIAILKSLHFAKAYELRTHYNITYFDSLHAATAITEDLELISFDEKAYSGITNLKYRHPRDLT